MKMEGKKSYTYLVRSKDENNIILESKRGSRKASIEEWKVGLSKDDFLKSLEEGKNAYLVDVEFLGSDKKSNVAKVRVTGIRPYSKKKYVKRETVKNAERKVRVPERNMSIEQMRDEIRNSVRELYAKYRNSGLDEYKAISLIFDEVGKALDSIVVSVLPRITIEGWMKKNFDGFEKLSDEDFLKIKRSLLSEDRLRSIHGFIGEKLVEVVNEVMKENEEVMEK